MTMHRRQPCLCLSILTPDEQWMPGLVLVLERMIRLSWTPRLELHSEVLARRAFEEEVAFRLMARWTRWSWPAEWKLLMTQSQRSAKELG